MSEEAVLYERKRYNNYFSRTINDLCEMMNNHILYELDMLQSTIERNNELVEKRLDGEKINPFELNLLIESFTTHANNLIEFLTERLNKYGRKKTNYKARAVDYFIVEDNWYKILDETNLDDFLKEYNSKTKKEVLGLTYKRKNANDFNRGWDMNVAKVIFYLMNQFYYNLLSMYKSQKANRFFVKLSKRINEQKKVSIRINQKAESQKDK